MSDSASSAYSVPAPQALLRQALARYGWSDDAKLGLRHVGTDALYGVIADRSELLLRVYSAHRDRPSIVAETELLDHLQNEGCRAPRVIKTVDGGVTWSIEAPEGARTVVAYTYVAGRSPGWRLTQTDAKAFGRAAALLHVAADAMPASWRRYCHDAGYLLGPSVEALIERAPLGLGSLLAEARGVVAGELALFSTASAMDTGICHGDLHKRNFVVDAEGAATLIDFGCAGRGWRAYDLAVPQWSFQAINTDQGHRDRLFGSFLDGYSAERPVHSRDLSALPCFCLARQLWHMAVLLRRAVLGVATWEPLTDRWYERQGANVSYWLAAIARAPEY